jgi:hypothetical protein
MSPNKAAVIFLATLPMIAIVSARAEEVGANPLDRGCPELITYFDSEIARLNRQLDQLDALKGYMGDQ